MENEKRHQFANGVIYYFVNGIITGLKYINPVEWFKEFAKWKWVDEESESQNKYVPVQIAIDLFIILKFIIIGLIWHFQKQGLFWEVVIWILIISNVFTYFYYHVWKAPFVDSIHSRRRRFMNLFISIVFSNLCFVILYFQFYLAEFKKIPKGLGKESTVFLYSFYNSIFIGYPKFEPVTNLGFGISFVQLAITVIFLTVILSVTIPQHAPASEEEEEEEEEEEVS